MLRIEEIVGAMDDEFRYALAALDDQRLAALAADKAALRRLRPVGVSHAEAMAMIAAIQEHRAAKAAKARATARPRRGRRKPVPSVTVPPAAVPPAAAPVGPAVLPAPPSPPLLTWASGPAIRLGPPPTDAPAIPLPPPDEVAPAAPPSAPAKARRAHRWWLLLLLAISALMAVLGLAFG